MANYGVYATPYEIKEYLTGTSDAQVSGRYDERLARFCVEASRRFDAHCFRHFYPTYETRYYDHPNRNGAITTNDQHTRLVYGQDKELCLDEDLLALDTLKTQNGSTTITPSNILLKSGDGYNYTPYNRISLTLDSADVFTFSGTPQKANQVTGLWGCHEQYSNAWAEVDAVATTLSSSGTSCSVGDSDGRDELGLSERFQVLQLIRFGSNVSSEMALITEVGSDDTITLIRGVNGTTAAEQAVTTKIYVYRPMPELVQAMKVFVTYAWRRPSSAGSEGDRPLASPTGVILMPNKLPEEVKAMIGVYRRMDL